MKNRISLSFLILALGLTLAMSASSKEQAALTSGQASKESFAYTDFACAGFKDDGKWTYQPKFQSEKCGKNTYLGLYAKDASIQREYTDLKTHSSVYIEFKVAAVDGWKGDKIQIIVGNTIIAEQTFDSSSDQASNVCGGAGKDVFQKQTAQYDHTDAKLTLIIRSDPELASGSTWGLCDLEIHFNPCAANSFYDESAQACKDTCPSGTYPNLQKGTCSPCDNEHCIYRSWKDFSCANPVQSDNWQYLPGFKVVAGGKNNYVGGFGANGATGSGMASYYTMATPHQSIKLKFNLHLFGKWDQNTLTVASDGTQVWNKTFTSSDNADQQVDFHFNHNTGALRLVIQSDVQNADQSWGICDLQITVQNCTYNNGTCIDEDNIASSMYTAFDCQALKSEDQWNYTAGYQDLKCPSYNLLGAYTKGDAISRILPGLHKHQSIYIKVNLGMFDTWGSDEAVIFKADGESVYEKKFGESQANGTECGTKKADFLGPLKFEFPHNATQMLFEVTSSLSSTSGSWGICGLQVYINYCPIPKYYHKGVCVVKCPKRTRIIEEARTCEELPGSEEEEEETAEKKSEEEQSEKEEEQSEKQEEEQSEKKEEEQSEKQEEQSEKQEEQTEQNKEKTEQSQEQPEASGNQNMYPQNMIPQDMIPQGMIPQGMIPQGMIPQGMIPQGMYPQGGQGMYPQGGQGMYPQGGQGMYPQGGQGMYPQGGQGMSGNQGGAMSGNQGGSMSGNQGGSMSGNQGGSMSGNQGGSMSGNQGGSTSGHQGGANDCNCIRAKLNEGKYGQPGSISLGYGDQKTVVSESTPYSVFRGPQNEKIQISFTNGLANILVDNGKGFVQYSKNLGEQLSSDCQGSIIVRQANNYNGKAKIRKGCDQQVQAQGGLFNSNNFLVHRTPGDMNILGGAYNLRMGGNYRKAGGINLNLGQDRSTLVIGSGCNCQK